jgi:hypothetical protein
MMLRVLPDLAVTSLSKDRGKHESAPKTLPRLHDAPGALNRPSSGYSTTATRLKVAPLRGKRFSAARP